MSLPVYSIPLGRLPAFSGGPTEFYVVPAGYVAVVNTISIVWGDVSISSLDAWVQTADLTKLTRATIALPFQTDTGPGRQIDTGRWVLEAGDSLAAQTVEGTCDIFVSGYLLSLP